jgi:hypothetical protein
MRYLAPQRVTVTHPSESAFLFWESSMMNLRINTAPHPLMSSDEIPQTTVLAITGATSHCLARLGTLLTILSSLTPTT